MKEINKNKIVRLFKATIIFGVILALVIPIQAMNEPNNAPKNANTRNSSSDWTLHYVGSCETSYNADGLYVKGDYAYVTSWEESPEWWSPGYNQYVGALDVINISNPTNPIIEGSRIYDDTGWRSLRQPCDIYLQEDEYNMPFVYIVDSEQFHADGKYYIFSFNVLNSSNPFFIKHGDFDEKPLDLYCDQNYAHVVGPGCGYQPFDITSWGNDIPKIGDGFLEIGHYYSDIVVRGNYAYITDSTLPPPLDNDPRNDGISGSLKILDISDIEDPLFVASDGADDPQCLTVIECISGDDVYALVGCRNGLRIYNITVPLDVYDMSQLDFNSVLSVSATGNLAYIANRSTIAVVDISDPADLSILDVYVTTGKIMDLMAQDGFLFVTDADQGLIILQYGEQQAPDTPIMPTGPNLGFVGEEYTFLTNTSDPQGQDVFYQWDWGDGNISDWLGPYTSGEVIETVYLWGHPSYYEFYEVKVRAKDEEEHISEYSEPLLIYIEPAQEPKPELQVDLNDGKGLSLSIQNVGTDNAYDVIINLSIQGGLYVRSKEYSESLGTLIPDNLSESYIPVFGIGLGIITDIPTISLTLTASNVESILITRTARIFLNTIVLVDVPNIGEE